MVGEITEIIKNDMTKKERMILVERELNLFSTGKFSSREEARKAAKEQLKNEQRNREKNKKA